jgi:hypothetical protein
MKPSPPQTEGELRQQYLRKAIEESARAAREGTLDFDSSADVELSLDGAWVNARVWVPKAWLEPK